VTKDGSVALKDDRDFAKVYLTFPRSLILVELERNRVRLVWE
jgi:hypothetical protein